MIIDAHAHIWTQNTGMYPWSPIGDYVPTSDASIDKLVSMMDSAGVDRAVLVQPTPYGWDNSYLLDAACRFPDRFKVVCLVDPFSLEGSRELTELVSENGIAGLRINWNIQPLERWRDSSDHRALWETIEKLGIPVCVQLTPLYFGLFQEFCSRHPGIPVVIDHLARPEPGCSPQSHAFQEFLGFSEYRNVHIKLSGLYYYSTQEPPYEDGWELIWAAYRWFGAGRCLWGSDFPFVLERWSYTGIIEGIRTHLDLQPDELERILGGTSRRLWWGSEGGGLKG